MDLTGDSRDGVHFILRLDEVAAIYFLVKSQSDWLMQYTDVLGFCSHVLIPGCHFWRSRPGTAADPSHYSTIVL